MNNRRNRQPESVRVEDESYYQFNRLKDKTGLPKKDLYGLAWEFAVSNEESFIEYIQDQKEQEDAE